MNANSPPPIPKLGTPAGNAGGFPVLQIPGSSVPSTTQLQPSNNSFFQSRRSSIINSNSTTSTQQLHQQQTGTSLSDLLNNHQNTRQSSQSGRNSPVQPSKQQQGNEENNNNNRSNSNSNIGSPIARKPPATLTSISADRANVTTTIGGGGDTTTAASPTSSIITDLRQYPLHSGSLHEAMNSMLRALIAISEEQKTLKESVQFTESSSKALNQKVLNEISEVNREFVQNLVRKKDWSDARFDDHRKVENLARIVGDMNQNLNTESGTIVPRIQQLEKQHEDFKKETETHFKKVVSEEFFEAEVATLQDKLKEMSKSMEEIGKEMKKASLEDLEHLQEEYAGSIKTTNANLVQRIEQLSMNQQAFQLKISQQFDSMQQNLQTVTDRVAVLEVDVKSDREKVKTATDDLTAELQKQEEGYSRWKKAFEERFTSFHNGAFLRLARLETGAEESGRAQTVASRELTQVQSAVAEINGDLNQLQTQLSTDEGSLRKLIDDVSKRVSESEAYTKQKIETQAEDWRSTKTELDKKLKSVVQEATESSAAVWKQQQKNESAWQDSIATNIELKLRTDFAKSLTEADETIAKLRSQLLRVDETQHVVINDLRTLNKDLSSQQNQMDNVVESLSTLEAARAKEFQKSSQSERHVRQAIQELFDLVNAENTRKQYQETTKILSLPPFVKHSDANDDDDDNNMNNMHNQSSNNISALQEPIDKTLLEPVTLHQRSDGMLSLTPRSKQRQQQQQQQSLVNSRYTSPKQQVPSSYRTSPSFNSRGKELTRDIDLDLAENLQVFQNRHQTSLRSPPRRGSDNKYEQQEIIVTQDPLDHLPSTTSLPRGNHQQPRSNSSQNNNQRSGSALIIPAGLPKLGLEVANRRNGMGGVVVLGVTSHLPAYAAGLCRGDIIVALGDQEVRTKQDFVDALQTIVSARAPGERLVTIDVSYVAVSIEGEYDATPLEEIPESRKRKVQITASLST